MNSLVSVIIPVYKVEAFIEKCMQSLLDQTYTNFEALIVDDGSPDNSIKLAKSVVGDDPRFIFFEKENGGQGTARNLGLDNAKGDYIAFLDSDDYYEKDYLRLMTEKISKESADVCICNINYVDVNGKLLKVNKNDLEKYIASNDILMAYRYISNFMWDKLFTKKCFDILRFDPNVKTYEDVHLLFRILYGKKITSIKKSLYNYLQRSGSTMHSFPKSYIEDRYNIYLTAEGFYNKISKCEKVCVQQLVHHYFNNFIFDSSVRILKYSEYYSTDIRSLLSKKPCDAVNYKELVFSKTIPVKNKFAIALVTLSPSLYKFFMGKWLAIKYTNGGV